MNHIKEVEEVGLGALIIFFVFISYGFVNFELSVGDLHLGKLKIVSDLKTEELAINKIIPGEPFGPNIDSSLLLTPKVFFASSVVHPCDSSKKTLLLIGDSMVSSLRQRLAAYCKANGHRLYAVNGLGQGLEWYGSNDTITHFINEFNADFVLVSLGANDLFVTNIAQKRGAMLKHILNELKNIDYLWIGPPNWKEDAGINDFLASEVDKGRFFLSKGLELERMDDGVHPTKKGGGKKWVDRIAKFVMYESTVPILLKEPEEPQFGNCKTVMLSSD